MLRRIDWLLDFDAIRHELAALYSHTGLPSVDPKLMPQMLRIGYICGIRSSRRPVEDVHLDFAYHELCTHKQSKAGIGTSAAKWRYVRHPDLGLPVWFAHATNVRFGVSHREIDKASERQLWAVLDTLDCSLLTRCRSAGIVWFEPIVSENPT